MLLESKRKRGKGRDKISLIPRDICPLSTHKFC